MMIFFKKILIFLFFAQYASNASDVVDVQNGALILYDTKFLIESKTVDLIDHCKKLAQEEAPLTEFLAATESELSMRNITLASFILIDEDGMLHSSKIEAEGDIRKIIFESGKHPSTLSMAQTNLNKKLEVNFYTLKEKTAIFDKYNFGFGQIEKSEKNQSKKDKIIDDVYEHFSLLWNANYLPLTEDEERFYKSSEIDISRITDDFKKVMDVKVDDEEEGARVIGGTMLTLLTQVTDTSSSVEVLRSNRGIVKYLEDISKQIKRIQDSAENIFKRWCSEQKLIKFLKDTQFWKENLESEKQKLGEKKITACFLHVHTYQNPCTCCRFTFCRALRSSLKEAVKDSIGNSPFHIFISYRQDYPNESFDASVSDKEVFNLLDYSYDAPYVFLNKIEV